MALTRKQKQAIYERDGWTCSICGKRVDREAKAPAPLSPSIDHRLARSKRGGDDPANLACAHLACNIDKREHEDIGKVRRLRRRRGLDLPAPPLRGKDGQRLT